MIATPYKIVNILPRLLLAGLILFELLNEFGILRYTLDFTWLGLVVTSVIAWTVLEIAAHLLKKSCGQTMNFWAIVFAIGIIYVDALGDILHLYSKFGWYDQMAHFVGGVVVAGLVYNIIWHLCRCRKISMRRAGMAFVAIAVTTFINTLYEIEEYLEDYFTGSHRLGDGPDTANDLLLSVLGAAVIILFVNIISRLKLFKISDNQEPKPNKNLNT